MRRGAVGGRRARRARAQPAAEPQRVGAGQAADAAAADGQQRGVERSRRARGRRCGSRASRRARAARRCSSARSARPRAGRAAGRSARRSGRRSGCRASRRTPAVRAHAASSAQAPTMTPHAPHPGRIRPSIPIPHSRTRLRMPIGSVQARAARAPATTHGRHLRRAAPRTALPCAGRGRAGGGVPLGGGRGRALPLRQPADRVDARLPARAVDGRPRALAAAHPPGRPRAGHERRGRRQEDRAARQRVPLPARATGTSCGCATRRAGSSARTAQACFEGVFADVTERKQAELELTHTAQHDPLTGLVNRASSRAQLEQELTRQRLGVVRRAVRRHRPLQARQRRPRARGGRCAAARGRPPAAGRAARGRRPLALRRRRVHRLPAGLRRRAAPRSSRGASWPRSRSRSRVARGEVYVGGSVGIALTGGDSETATDLIRDADVAMYAAKQGGRGRLAALRHEPARGLGAARRDGQRAPPRARARGDRDAHAADRRPRATGAWPASRRCCAGGAAAQVVPPLEFVPLAEEAGLIAEIERFALAEACRMGQRARGAARRARRGQRQRLAAARAPGRPRRRASSTPCAARGFDPGSLLVELTESERIEDVDGLADVLGAVRELGVSVALDDFGTGWSTLGLLRRVPFDALKIDRSFTAGLPGEPQRSRARRGHRDARAQPRRAGRRRGHRAARAARLAARGRLRSRPGLPVRAAEHGRAARASGSPRATRARSSTSLVRPELLDVLPVGVGRVAAGRQEAAAGEARARAA